MSSKTIVAALLLSLLTILVSFYFLINNQSLPQPVYFAKVVFGKEVSAANTKLFMTQGQDVFLDSNGDKLPQQNEKIKGSDHAKINSGNQQFEITLIDLGVNPELVSESRPQKLILYVDALAEHKYQLTGQLKMDSNSESDDFLHFGGQLNFLELEPIALQPQSNSKQDLKIYLGTMPNDKASATVVAPNKLPPFPMARIKFDDQPDTSLEMDYFC